MPQVSLVLCVQGIGVTIVTRILFLTCRGGKFFLYTLLGFVV